MAKGDRSSSERVLESDPLTGAVVRRMTSHPSINHPAYFLNRSFSIDQETLIFTSYRTGSAQLFEAGYPDGEIRQLTDAAAIHPFSPTLAPGADVLFVRGGSVLALDRESLAERTIAEFPGQLGECSLSADGEWFTAAFRGDAWGVAVGRTDGSLQRVHPFPRTIIHPQYHPLDPEWIEFAADPAPRMHRIRRDGSNLECLYQHGNDEFVVHETFLGTTGDLVFTVWPQALKRMEWESRRITTIAEFNAWHITPDQSGRRVLCDTVHPDIGLQIVDVATGNRTAVCRSDASSGGSQWKTSRYALPADWEAAQASAAKDKALSWMEMAVDTVYGPQWTHPHPSFSPDEHLVAFASDRSGYAQVYVAEIPG